MSDMNGSPQDTLMTEARMLQDLEALARYCSEAEIGSRVVPAGQAAALPSLVALLDPDEQGRPRVLTNSFVPLDREDAEFTKFLQFYCELPASLEGVDRTVLLEALLRFNSALPFGGVVLVDPRPELGLPLMAAVRTVQGFPLDTPIDQGVFTEDLFLFDMSCELVASVMDDLAKGSTLDEAFAALSQETE